MQNNTKITFNLNEDITRLFFILNAIGYDDENNREGMHPVREKSRQVAEQYMDNSWKDKFQQYLKDRTPYRYVAWLLLNQNGTEKEVVNMIGDQAETVSFKKFEEVFNRFIQEKDDIIPWEEIKHSYQLEKNAYEKLFTDSITNLISTLNLDNKHLGISEVVIIPNLLDAHGRGYGIKARTTAFVVYGPVDKNVPPGYGDDFLIKHEFLHSIINPIVDDIIEADEVEVQNKNYNDLRSVIAEYLIRAITVKYSPCSQDEKREMLDIEIKSGFPEIEHIYDALLDSYSKNELVKIAREIVSDLTITLEKEKR